MSAIVEHLGLSGEELLTTTRAVRRRLDFERPVPRSVSLADEAETAAIVGIPIDRVTIGALTPVAYTLGTDFRPARRPAPEDVIHWDAW
ncbi:MAG TPA: hypothetical protein VK501_08610 [Baekduia sp.]|uniref:hypothetical protein n=1 Tax=Baekduia sp. TaxID=2600305 RepID=UPI002CA87BED|nr:hypothetical protein [Baekduia sp.]HMJ33966.1 hypothetical protein [Baekduia sp.]